MADDNFEPLIIAFCCNWCSYAGADLAGVSRLQYPPNILVIRVMCSGMVHPNLVIDALTKGADAVLICGCHPGDCHYLEGNLRAQDRKEALDLMLEDFGLEPERFRLECRLMVLLPGQLGARSQVSQASGPRLQSQVFGHDLAFDL